MNVSDDQLVRSVRESVDARPGAGVPVEQVVRRGRRRVAVRRGVAGAAVAIVAAGAVALSVGGLPLVTSAPPARQPSVTLSPDPSRTTALRPVTDMYGVGDAAIVRAGLPLFDTTGRWGVSRGADAGRGSLTGSPDDVVAGTSGPGYLLSTAHLTAPPDPGATSCAELTQDPITCVREPQDDDSVLFTLTYEGELVQYLLLHTTGFVQVEVQGPPPPEARLQDPFEPPTPESLRTLALDPDLRW